MLGIDTNNLEPVAHKLSNGNVVHCFHSDAVELVKMDFSFEAGSAYQDKLLLSATTANLIGEGTERHTAQEIAEFMDFRGIVIERCADITTPSITFYTLKKFLPELMPWIKEILCESSFPQKEFDVHVHKRRRQLMAQRKKTSAVAMTAAYESLYGKDHPLGKYAVPEDFDVLTVEDVRRFYKEHYHIGEAHIVLSGNIDDQDLALCDQYFGHEERSKAGRCITLETENVARMSELRIPMEGAVQSSLRIGRVLPLSWDSMEYARFMILTTILGGYFGSRLMNSVREEKGYTYGISSHTHIYRGSIVFFITTDVGGEYTQPALDEIFRQIELLKNEPVSTEELELVRNVMEGDFLRSIDGVFERSERYRQMALSGMDERFREHYFEALENTTPADIQRLAKDYLVDLTTTVCGVV